MEAQERREEERMMREAKEQLRQHQAAMESQTHEQNSTKQEPTISREEEPLLKATESESVKEPAREPEPIQTS